MWPGNDIHGQMLIWFTCPTLVARVKPASDHIDCDQEKDRTPNQKPGVSKEEREMDAGKVNIY